MYSPKRARRLFWHPAWTSTQGSMNISSTALATGSSAKYDNTTGYFDVASNTAFTVEWFQYALSNTASAPRPFSIGTYSTATLALSFEGSDAGGRTMYLWRGGSAGASLGSIPTSNLVNTWNHFAIVGDGTQIRVYRNGTQLGLAYTYSNLVSTNTLNIGNETTNSSGAAFNGYITNFRWVNGTAVYTGAFTTPTSPLTAISGTKLLLLSPSNAVTTDSGPGARAATTAGSVTWISNKPFA